MALNLPADVNTQAGFVPIVVEGNQRKLAGTHLFYRDIAALNEAVTAEQAAVSVNPVMIPGTPIQVGQEPGVRRFLQNLSVPSSSHARTFEFSNGKQVVLVASNNVVHRVSGAPASGFGATNDYAVEVVSGSVYLKGASTWSLVDTIGGAASSLPLQVAFSTAIPLDGNKVMARTQISGAVALTVGAKVAGGQCRVPFIANGTNVPTVSGSSESSSSRGFINTAGSENVFDFWTDDGALVRHAISGLLVDTPVDVLGPVIVSVAINGVTAVVTYDETIAATPSASAYTLHNAGGAANQTPTAVSRSGTAITLTFATAAIAANTVTLDASAGAVADALGNQSLAVTGRSVTNNTPVTDIIAPSITARVVNGVTVTLTLSETPTSTPAASVFTVHNAGGVASQTPTAVSRSANVVTLTLATGAVGGNTPTLDVSAGAFIDAAGNASAAVTGAAITNATGMPGTAMTLSSLNALTTSNGGVTYVGTTGSTNYGSYGKPGSLRLPANTSGRVMVRLGSLTNGAVVVGFSLTDVLPQTGTLEAQMQISTAAGQVRYGTATGVGVIVGSTALGPVDTWYALDREDNGTTAVYKVLRSDDGGATWSTVYTTGATSRAAVYPQIYTIGDNTVYNPRHVGLA